MISKQRLIITIPCLLLGGTEKQTLNLARVLISSGYRVTVCCYYEYDNRMVDSFRENGAEVILMGIERSQGLFDLVRKLKALFQKIKPDIVHVQYMAPGFAPIVAARLSGIRTIFATVHQPGRVHGFKAKCLLRAGALLCTAFFCVSQAAEKSWFGSSHIFDPTEKHRLGRKHYTVYNAVDVDRIDAVIKATDRVQLKRSLGLEGCLVVGVVGRLREEKGQASLISTMPAVIQAIPNARLLIIGDGPDRERLQALAASLELEDHIRWTGEKEPVSVIPYYAIMDVAVSPSRFEGFGLAAAEAMAAGCPVIASNIDGLNEVVEHGQTGYLVPVGDSGEIADRIVILLSDPARASAMGDAGRERVDQLFSMALFSKSILRIYR